MATYTLVVLSQCRSRNNSRLWGGLSQPWAWQDEPSDDKRAWQKAAVIALHASERRVGKVRNLVGSC